MCSWWWWQIGSGDTSGSGKTWVPLAPGLWIGSTVDSTPGLLWILGRLASWRPIAPGRLQSSQQQQLGQGTLCSWASSKHLQPSLEPLPSHYSRAVASIPDHTLINSQGRFKHSVKTSSGTARAPGMSSSYAELPNGMSLLVTIWQTWSTWTLDITVPKSDWLYSLQSKMEKFCTVSKNKTGSWLWLRS